MALEEVTPENFDELTGQGTVLIDVWGPACQPCLALLPTVEALAAEHPQLRVVKLEAPKARRLCITLKVHGLPTFLLFVQGEEVARISESNLSAPQLTQWLEEELKAVGV